MSDNQANQRAEGAPPDLMVVAQQLNAQHDRLNSAFLDDVRTQGFIGKLADGAKNRFGASGTDTAGTWAGVWSGMVNSDEGSAAIKGQFDDEARQLHYLEKAAQQHDTLAFDVLYRNLTGQQFDSQHAYSGTLQTASLGRLFGDSQLSAVESVTDTVAALMAIISTRLPGAGGTTAKSLGLTMGSAFALGASTKTGLKMIDHKYSNPTSDVLTGGLMGLTVPLGELAGASASRLVGGKLGLGVTDGLFTAQIDSRGAGFGVRMLSSATRAGTAGAVFGGLERPARMTLRDMHDGREIHALDVLGTGLKGAGLGFMGGTALGLGADGAYDGISRLFKR